MKHTTIESIFTAMNRFLKYLDDENFLRQICNNDPEMITEVNEEKKQFASLLIKVLTELNIKEPQLSPGDRKEILNRLLQEIENPAQKRIQTVIEGRSRNSAGIRRISTITRYAAAALLLLTIGAGIYLLLPRKEDPYTKYFAQEAKIQPNNSTRIILSDGRVIDVDSKNADIQYEKDKIIINQKDTLLLSSREKEGSGSLPDEKEMKEGTPHEAFNHIIIPHGRTASLTLPDGSTVYLNAATQIKYPVSFGKRSREVMLKGEAYFEVSKDKQRPFIVNANNQALIKVLGTHFDVSAYDDDNIVKTTLVEGSITVSSITSKQSSLVSPGEQVEMDMQGKMIVRKVNTEQYTSWREGLFLFDKESFGSVLKKLERYYNIRFAFEEPMKGEIKISGKLNLKTDLEEIIEILQTTSSTTINTLKDGYYVVK